MLLSAKISLRAMTGGITVLAFYNNVQQIESLKNYFYDWNWNYLIAADIHKTEQEIKDIFNITTEPTIIYYEGSKEIARSNNFDINDISQHINTSFAHNRNTPQFSELKNLIQESYNTDIENIMNAKSCEFKILAKKPIKQELAQLRFSIFLEALAERGTFGDITAVVFYNNTEQIEPLKNLFKEHKTAYLITADINKTEQEITSAFNVTKPTIIYYKRGEEVGRTNFDTNNIAQHIKNIAPILFLKRNRTEYFFNIEDVQIEHCIETFDATIVAFYNNAQKIENLKNIIKNMDICLVIADINKTNQGIKNAFNITTEPTLIYYNNRKEMARRTSFDTKDILRHIDYSFLYQYPPD